MRRRRWRWWGISLTFVLAGIGSYEARWWRTIPSVPTAEVKVGEFVSYFEIRGDLKTLRSVTLMAPAVSGDLQIIRLAKNGSQIKSGEPLPN